MFEIFSPSLWFLQTSLSRLFSTLSLFFFAPSLFLFHLVNLFMYFTSSYSFISLELLVILIFHCHYWAVSGLVSTSSLDLSSDFIGEFQFGIPRGWLLDALHFASPKSNSYLIIQSGFLTNHLICHYCYWNHNFASLVSPCFSLFLSNQLATPATSISELFLNFILITFLWSSPS
jgi:hypothetical protein